MTNLLFVSILSFVFLFFLVMLLVFINKIRKWMRRKQKTDYPGIENENKSCFFNSCMQILASMDDLCIYLEESKLKKESLTKKLHSFLKKIRTTKGIVENKADYKMIMSSFKEGDFLLDDENSADEFFSLLLNSLFEEEIEEKKISSDFLSLKKNSFLFNLFCLSGRNKEVSLFLNTKSFPSVQETIDAFLSGENEFSIPFWEKGTNILSYPSYFVIIFSSQGYNVSSFDFQKNNSVLLGGEKYFLNSAVLYGKAFLFYNHYTVLVKKEDSFYSFDDMIVKKINIKEKINEKKSITFLVYEKKKKT